MPKNKVLQFGLQRSGTNYLQELVSESFDVNFCNSDDRLHPLHKHFRLYDEKSYIGRPAYQNDIHFHSFKDFEKKSSIDKEHHTFLIISKDPYSWYLSYKRWGEKHKWPPCNHQYIVEYNLFYAKWLRFAEETSRIEFVKYVDLLIDSSTVLKIIGEKHKLSPRPESAVNKRIKKVPMSSRFSSKKMKYYIKREYLNDFSSEELETLNQSIDHDLIMRLGYKSYFPQ